MLNAVVLVGRVGRNAQLKYFESGRVFASFSLAISRPVKKGKPEVTDWFEIELWGRLAEIAGEYVKKGSLVGIEGRLEFKKVTDQRGENADSPYIAANNLRLLGSRQDLMMPSASSETDQ